MTIGVLGGIGPEASAYFYGEIVKRLKTRGFITRNADYPHIIVNSITAPELVSPEVTDEMLEPYAEGIRELILHTPKFIVMACNTIHLFRDRLVTQTGFDRIISIRDVVQEGLRNVPRPLCILGTAATVSSGLYTFPGYEYVNPDAADLESIGHIVVNYNAHGFMRADVERLDSIIAKQRARGAQTYVAACTEISALLSRDEQPDIIDTFDLLIEHVIARITDARAQPL